MGYDAVVDSAKVDDDLVRVANAIRAKAGSANSLSFPDGMVTAIESIGAGIESAVYEYSQTPDLVQRFIDEVVYSADDYTASEIPNYAPATPSVENYAPKGVAVKTRAGNLVRKNHYIDVSDGTAMLYNDVPNHVTEFVVLDGGNIVTTGTVKPTSALRQIKCNTTNVRDLGGWACDGGSVKYGKLFRGGEYNEADYDVFIHQLGIRHELNLRGSVESEENRTTLRDHVCYTCPEKYLWYTTSEQYSDTWREVLRCVFDCAVSNIPLYFHCSAGADRTGTVAAIVEGLLGVSQSDIDKDYELTCFCTGTVDDTSARRRNESEWTSFMNRINGYSGGNFRDKVVGWVVSLGFTNDEVNAFRMAMIDGEPELVNVDIAEYSVDSNVEGVEIDNSAVSAMQYQPFNANLTAPAGYAIANVRITMGGIDITRSVFDGRATTLNRAVTKNTVGCKLSNANNVVIDGQGYVCDVTADDGYSLEDVAVTIYMGGIDVSAFYSSGKIAIPSVTGDIVITAQAIKSAVETIPVTIVSGYRCDYTVGSPINVTEGSNYAISEEIDVVYGKTYNMEYTANAADFGAYFVGYNDSGTVTEYMKIQPGSSGAFVAKWSPTISSTTKMRLRGYANSLTTAGITELVVS